MRISGKYVSKLPIERSRVRMVISTYLFLRNEVEIPKFDANPNLNTNPTLFRIVCKFYRTVLATVWHRTVL